MTSHAFHFGRMVSGLLAAGLLTVGLGPAVAHGPTPQKIEETVVISASPDAVWKVAGDFASIAAWNARVKTATVTGGNTPGAERVLVLDRGEITEGLDEYDAAERKLSYRLSKENPDALAVSFYTALLTVTPTRDGKSKVGWSARFYRADTSNFPPDELNDEAAIAAMADFFRTGLQGLKAKVEGR